MKFSFQKLDLIIRLLIGLLFLFSASFKLKVIDSFEIYIYSFEIISLANAFLLARLIITFELFLGLILIIGIYLRTVILLSISVLSAFVIFIFYLIITKNPEHCYCFGEFIEISHFSSAIKNIILIVLLIIIYKRDYVDIKHKKLVLIIALILCISIPSIFSPPDSIVMSRYTESGSYNEDLLYEFIDENHKLLKDKRILCFYGTKCKFCKLAAKKISVIVNKANSADIVSCIFWGSENSINTFFTETYTSNCQYSVLPASTLLKITNGTMPLIILIEDNEIRGNYGYRTINENEILEFISN
jgi:uncharacterized membrane protein YphA (DoxX/SURF4 family)